MIRVISAASTPTHRKEEKNLAVRATFSAIPYQVGEIANPFLVLFYD